MSTFAVEDDVRLKLQLSETAASAELIADCLLQAHLCVLMRLDPAADTEPETDRLRDGEALLAGALALRALAAGQAADRRSVTLAGQRLDTGARGPALCAAAASAECRGWERLAPLLATPPAPLPALTTDPMPILGRD
jgi:hypothetical protein